MSLTDKVAVVTGSSSGSGAAIAIKFAAEGAKVAIVDRNQTKLAAVAKEVEKHGSKPLVIAADVTKKDDAKRIVDDTVKHFGRIDILVNSAGISGIADILDQKYMDVFDSVLSTNLRSTVYLTHLTAPHLIATKGNIVNISSSTSTSISVPNVSAYTALKAALDHFTRCVALELAEKGVRVNCVNPGPFKSDILKNTGMDRKKEDQVYEQLTNLLPLKRLVEVEEIADLAAFVASDRGRSITGSCLLIDSGYVLSNTKVDI